MRAFPLIRSLKAAIWMTVLMVLPVFVLGTSVSGGLYGMWLTAVFSPALLLIAGLWGGLLPLLSGLAAALALPFLALDYRAGLIMALYLVPFVLTYIITVSRGTPFFRAAGILCSVYLLSAFSCLLILQNAAEGSLYTVLAQRIVSLINRSQDGDLMLITFYQNGMITLDPSLVPRAQGMLGGLSALGRQELSASLTGYLADLFSQTPSLLMSYGIWCCFGGFGLALYLGRRSVQKQAYGAIRRQQLMDAVSRQQQAVQQGDTSARLELESYEKFLERMAEQEKATPLDYPELGMPSLSKWYLSRPWGFLVLACSIGLMMARLGTSLVERNIGSMLGAVFTTAYTLQGIAAFDFLQKKAGRSLAGRSVFTLVLMLFFRILFILLGLIDQVTNFRRLRPVEPQSDD